jgi:hypothetical protein
MTNLLAELRPRPEIRALRNLFAELPANFIVNTNHGIVRTDLSIHRKVPDVKAVGGWAVFSAPPSVIKNTTLHSSVCLGLLKWCWSFSIIRPVGVKKI